uniref:Carboxypeptidase regulatory-like domain-containing protein n=1 Tax=uncultured Armatimonadetes bacterium TaxID=157466 RepID=A0A6J4J6H1_9BACT|nr:hypothetical protein AVDCRST_MAG63-2869 [uncultured Armatimonadetes bacterium]
MIFGKRSLRRSFATLPRWSVVAAAFALLLAGCGGGGGDDDGGNGGGGGTATITGRVTDATSGGPVANAQIRYGSIQTATNAQGEFSFSVPAGEGQALRITGPDVTGDGRGDYYDYGQYRGFAVRISSEGLNVQAVNNNQPLVADQVLDIRNIVLYNINDGPPPPPSI